MDVGKHGGLLNRTAVVGLKSSTVIGLLEESTTPKSVETEDSSITES